MSRKKVRNVCLLRIVCALGEGNLAEIEYLAILVHSGVLFLISREVHNKSVGSYVFVDSIVLNVTAIVYVTLKHKRSAFVKLSYVKHTVRTHCSSVCAEVLISFNNILAKRNECECLAHSLIS